MRKKVYLIAYELVDPESIKRRKKIGEAIKKFTGLWWHYCDVWLVAGEIKNSEVLFEKMSALLKLKDGDETDDSLFVVRVSSRDNQGWLPDSAWNWIKIIVESDAKHD